MAQHWSPESQGLKVPVEQAQPRPVQPERDPPPAMLPEPPLAFAIALPPPADAEMSVTLETVPPETLTLPRVLPTPIVLPALPPLLILPMETVPPWAFAVATPPLPALAEPAELQTPPMQEAVPQQAASEPQRLPS
jgi:hypothetical protein